MLLLLFYERLTTIAPRIIIHGIVFEPLLLVFFNARLKTLEIILKKKKKTHPPTKPPPQQPVHMQLLFFCSENLKTIVARVLLQ